MSKKPAAMGLHAIHAARTLHDLPVNCPGSADVLINGAGALRTGDIHTCKLHGPEDVRLGVDHVRINGRNAVREGDFLQGSGPSNRILAGSLDVFIGAPEMSGTGSKENIDWFCKRWCALLDQWPNMTPDQRRKAYKDLLEEQFKRLGMPSPNLTENAAKGSAAAFNAKTWTVLVPEGSFDGDQPPHQMGEGVLHETRHAEQVYAAARERAGRQKISSEELDSISDCRDDVDQAAYDNPLDPDSPEGRWARLHGDEHLSEEGRKQFKEICKEYGEAAKVEEQDPARMQRAREAYWNRPGGADADEVGKKAYECSCGNQAIERRKST